MAKELASRARRQRLLCAAACLLLASLCAGPARAQETQEGGQQPPPPRAAHEPVARKVTEYVNQFTSCNAGAHLDVLAIELQNDTQARGYIVIYGPGGSGDRYAARALDATKNYLVNSRGMEESRIEVKYGGVYRSKAELLTELWLVPDGAERPPEVVYKNDAASFKGKFAEFETWDDTFAGFSEVEGWSSAREVTSVGLADVLHRSGGTRAYIVVFNGEETAPGAWRRIAERETAMLNRHGIAEDRVRVIFGGYEEKPTLQLWVLPEDAPPPAKDAGRERGPEKAVQISTAHQYALKYPETARKVFKHFADVLKADESLTAHVFVRLGAPNEDEPGETPPPPDPEEPPDVDLARLVEKWKTNLEKEFGIGEQRLVVTVVPPGVDSSEGLVETWVVPPGVAPPDPFAAEVEAPANEAGEEAEEPEAEETETEVPEAEETPPKF